MSHHVNGHNPRPEPTPTPERIPTTLADLLTWREHLVDPDANVDDELHRAIIRWTRAAVARGVMVMSGIPVPPQLATHGLEAIRDGKDAVTEALTKSLVVIETVTLQAARQDHKLDVFAAACTCPDDSHQVAWSVGNPIGLMLASMTDAEVDCEDAPPGLAMATGLALDALWLTGRIDDLPFMRRVWNYALEMCCTVMRAHMQIIALRAQGIDPNTVVDEGGEFDGGVIL